MSMTTPNIEDENTEILNTQSLNDVSRLWSHSMTNSEPGVRQPSLWLIPDLTLNMCDPKMLATSHT